MAVTPTIVPVRPNRATVRWVSLAFAGAIAAVSVAALSTSTSQSASPATRHSTPTHIAVPMTPDAAERWLAPDPVEVRGMSADAAERWLDNE